MAFPAFRGRLKEIGEAWRFDEMAKRKKRIATVNRKLGILDQLPSAEARLERSRRRPKATKTSALRRLGKACHRPSGRSLKEPAELWEGAVEHMFPAGNGAKGDAFQMIALPVH